MKNNPERKSKLSTYAIVMLLSVIIIIVIAAMADDRERQFESQIASTTQTNMSIQQEIVTLKDEKYVLEQNQKEMQSQIDDMSKKLSVYNILNEALTLHAENKHDEAKAKLAELAPDSIPEECIKIYESVTKTIGK